MRDIVILTEADLRRCVTLNRQAVAVVEDAFRALASGKVAMPPILSMEIPEANGEVDVKTAYIHGFREQERPLDLLWATLGRPGIAHNARRQAEKDVANGL